MEYVEDEPPEDLRRHIQCLWVLRDDSPDDAVQVVYPDGRCELLAEFGVPLRFQGPEGELRTDQPFCFAGQQLGPIRLQAAGPVHCLGVRLSAACSGLIAGLQLPELRNAAPDLNRLDSAFAEQFRMAARACIETRQPGPLWQLLRSRCVAFTPDRVVEQAVDRLDSADGNLRINELAQQLGISMRTLQARFLHAVGMTPKEYARVRRLKALLHALDAEHAAIADVAAGHGYSDQSHATRDLTRLTGLTPARLLRALRDNRNGEDTLHLAAAFLRGYR